jgi:hypothetical protein
MYTHCQELMKSVGGHSSSITATCDQVVGLAFREKLS